MGESRPTTTVNLPQQQWRPAQVNTQQRQNLNRQYNARQTGAQRQQSFQMNRPAFRGGGRGGGRR